MTGLEEVLRSESKVPLPRNVSRRVVVCTVSVVVVRGRTAVG